MTAPLSNHIQSWGRVIKSPHHWSSLSDRHAFITTPPDGMSTLPFGNGRSYGDSNLNPHQSLFGTRTLDRFISFDPNTGVLRCEAGVLLSEILALTVPQGWFLTVTPGTQFVTVGGAIANDVHGKNHHAVGSFGNHVLRFELLRSNGHRFICSDTEHVDWFQATVGGLGLTGVITWAEIQLRRIHNPLITCESIKFSCLEEFFELSAASEAEYEYTVSWIDCSFTGKRLGRGLFNRGNHAPALPPNHADATRAVKTAFKKTRTVPATPPLSLINGLTLKAFNTLYYHQQKEKLRSGLQHYRPFFYPLDAINQWNRIYGPKGFYQYQCVIPPQSAMEATAKLLHVIASSGMGSFLAVLKQFGRIQSKGLLSFPAEGTTLALDFPNQGAKLHQLFQQLDQIVLNTGGRLYPAKDGRMTPEIFKCGFPAWTAFESFIDPRFSSGFWRRVTNQL